MPSKAVLSEEALRLLARGDVSDDFQLTKYDMYVLIDLAIDKAIKDNIRENQALERVGQGGRGSLNTEWLKRISLSTSFDSQVGALTASLPIGIRTLEHDAGLHLVGNATFTDIYTKIRPDYFEKFQGLEIIGMNKEVLYYLIDKTVVFFNLDENCSVAALVYPDTASMDENEELPIPSGFEQQVLRDVLELAQVMLVDPQDKVNDANGLK